MDDEPIGRVTHKVKGVTGHKRERRCASRLQHANIGWTDDFNLIHDVYGLLFCRNEINLISQGNVLESAEEPVSVSGDSDIAWRPNSSRTFNSSDSSVQCQIIGPVEDRNPDPDLGDL